MKPNEAAAQPPATTSNAPTDFKIQVPSQEGTPESTPPALEDALICTRTPWPEAGKMLGNLFETRKDWLLPSNYIDDTKSTANIISPKPPIKVEPKTEGQPSTSPKAEKCGGGPNCPFCKNQEEDWDGDHQKQLQMQLQPQQKIQMTQVQCPQTMSYQNPQSLQKFDWKTPDGRYPSHLKLFKQWEEEMERLNAKYNLDCFSESELDAESNEGEQYKYEHGYKTLI